MKTHTFIMMAVFCVVGIYAQDFMESGYTGTTQLARWEFFSYANTNSGIGNPPQIQIGEPQTDLLQYNPAIITTAGNIYSWSSDMAFEVPGSSTNELGSVMFQIFTFGQEDALSNNTTRLVLDGGAELLPNTLTNFYKFNDSSGTGFDGVKLGYAMEWNLSGFAATNYSIRFDLIQHTSLDRVLLETRAVFPSAPVPKLSIALHGQDVIVSFESEIGWAYQLLGSSSLTNVVLEWAAISTPLSGTGSTLSMTNAASASEQFFAVEVSTE